MSSFWLQFIINEALSVAQAFVGLSSLTPQQKTDLEAFIVAGQKVAQDFT
jgi:hypothetical protein